MSDHPLSLVFSRGPRLSQIPPVIRTEIIRKTIHMFIAFVPLLAQIFGRTITVVMLLVGVLFYTVAETLRSRGKHIPIVSRLTLLSLRQRDKGHFVLAPVTLGMGAVLALTLYPEPVASIAIYALAFGDGLSSLFGKIFGTIKIPFSGGKSIEGSIACFSAVLCSSFVVLQEVLPAIFIALFSTFIEVIPTKDLDNLIIPTSTGLFVLLLLG